jgi:hypothetical protein
LDEVLLWVDRNQLGRRNLTDAQYSFVRARIYEALKKAPHRPPQNEKDSNLLSFSGHDATAKEVAKLTGVHWTTILRDVKFKKACERLQEISPKAAEIVLRDEVRDAKTQLPKVPKEAFSFVANS